MVSHLSPDSVRCPTFNNHDGDTISIRSERSDRNDQDTDSEDDLVLMGGRTSADIRAHDGSILQDEEELDRLLVEEKRRDKRRSSALALLQQPLKIIFSQNRSNLKQPEAEYKIPRRIKIMRQRSHKKKVMSSNETKKGENGKLLCEMEEGGLKEETFTTYSSSESDEKEDISWRRLQKRHKYLTKTKTRQIKFLKHFFVIFLVFILIFMTWGIFFKKRRDRPFQNLISNGTALFAPTTILISLDGFRADFLHRGITPRLNKMIEEGVSPMYMTPSFPSVTFPNHYTLATGLYPESHGIVSNIFWDEELKEEFYYTNPSAMNSKWWGGEPIWVTAETQGVRTAVHMWPGSEAHIMGVDPTILDKFDEHTTLKEKTRRVLELIDQKGYENDNIEVPRPQLIASYVPNVDIDGHLYGPNTTDIRSTISQADQMLDEIFIGLEQRNLTNLVNVVVVSDHGMATTDINRCIQLEDLVNLDEINHIDGWPLIGLHPKENFDINSTYEKLSRLAASNQNFEVYLRDLNMPERYHFSRNKRIAPFWLVPKAGWAIPTKEEINIEKSKSNGLQYHPRGLHGYDHEHPLMRAIFVATGPAFPHIPSNRIKPFQNTEVYNIICDSLGITPQLNNGTLRLPLTPIDPQEPDILSEIPNDFEISPAYASDKPHLVTTASSVTDTPQTTTLSIQPTSNVEVSPINDHELPEINISWIKDKQDELWEWVKSKSDQLKNWWEEILPEQ